MANIYGSNGNDTLYGTDFDDYINGWGGDDYINGLGGYDRLYGGEGNDIVDGWEGNDTLYGENGNDTLYGGEGFDWLYGGEGDDTLYGGEYTNYLFGGAGNDTYITDNSNIVIEYANEGKDTVKSSVSYTLGANLENLILIGDVSGDIGGTGNTLNNLLVGNYANNLLNGAAGNDTLRGGAGNDQLYGENGNDSLIGGADRDTLAGGAGNDILTGAQGIDIFFYNTNKAFSAADIGVDTITDFSKGVDRFVLYKTTFTALSSPANQSLLAAEFRIVGSDALAGGSSADIVYSSATGKLFYNQNGTVAGFGTGGQFATLSSIPSLSATDFIVQA